MRDRVTRPLRGIVAVVVLLLTVLVAAPAEARQLRWSQLAVDARLDADGRLHVSERHEMVFTGDWNGGERIFDVRVGQKLDLQRLVRIGPGGEEIPLRSGSLDDVDDYDWADNRTLRWRSRRPNDPPFAETQLTYVLDYTLSHVLQPGQQSDVWLLDHDFAFPDREWPIERFTLDLELDPIWEPPIHFRRHHEVDGLPQYQGWVGTWQLLYTGEGQPAAVPRPAPLLFRYSATAAALVAIYAFLFALFRREWKLGRLDFPDDLPEEPDRAWIEEHLLALPAEQVGALWDRKVGTAEVAALLARLVAEGKLESEVEPKKNWWGSEVLRLRLLAPRDSFTSYEKALVNKLFFNDRTQTDTELVREHYQTKGFDPVGQIKGGIESVIAKRVRSHSAAPSKRRSLALFATCIAAFLIEALVEGVATAVVFSIFMGFATLPVFGVAAALATAWRDRVHRAVPWSLSWLLPGVWTFAAAAGALFLDRLPFASASLFPGVFGTLGILLIPVVVFSTLTNAAASREGREAIRRRQELAHLRRHLARELRRQRPDLDDRWLPYLIAFGLGHQVAGWGRRWGVAGGSSGGVTSLGGSSGSSLGGGGWTGGGGTFGGAGASAAWATAAAGMAAGVSTPGSSSGGGGGGGGGGSSGGGGGGGW